ncbi:hypothetical protein FB451DRAFT_1334859 [Mycena latifolia]|nr:hypothetical protein FB451DRAFT_1334859 [Mycena latifolia]
MAPNFLSKLVNKSPSTQTRDRSLSSPSPPSPASRSRTPSSVDNSMSSRNNGSNSNTFSSVNTKSMYSSGNPSVTVIPPSPIVNNSDVPDLPTYRPTSQANDPKIDGLPHTRNSSIMGSDESGTPRPPVPVKPVPPAPAVPRPPTPKTSERTPKSSPQIPTTSLPSVRRQASDKSLKGQQPQEQPSPVPPVPPVTAHMRAATSPAFLPLHSAEAEEPPVPNPLTESPPSMRPTEFPPQISPTPSWSPGGPSRRDTDVLSITSQGQKKKPASRPWRRSAPKKPMGLAGAIAASGLAMANPGMTAPHQSTLSPQVMNTNENKSSPSLVTSPIGNPNRKLTASPDAVSVGHRRHRTATNGKPHRENSGGHRRRRTTGSAVSHGEEDEQGEYYSGLDESSDDGSGSESSEGSGSDLEDLDLGEDDIPVTGFAVASNKRNADFHELFPGIPEGDYLIEDYGCALQREILIQGRIYVSENHICFHANIFGWVTDLLIPIYEITTLEKRMTAFVIPNAIRVGTARAEYTFASFLSRDTTFDVIHNIWRLARPGDAGSIGSGSMEGNVPHIAEGTIIGGAVPGAAAKAQRKATTCACGKEGSHFSEVALDTVVPGSPDRIYNLMFASGFMKDFMAVNQKLLDIQVSDWTPTKPGSKLLARNMSYIKPLNASLGPKQTKCEIRDETVHVDFDDYVSTLTTTRTPDVPSGGVFSVKTRTCIMWASPLSTKVVVSTQVEWTGRSFIKGIIERSAIDGQKVYHADLDKAMRAYIQEHQSEFMPEGVDPAQIAPEPAADAAPLSPVVGEPLSEKKREQERHQRGLQWAWDTFEGASQVARQSTKGALELIRDAWENSTSSTILYALIVVLLISNVWTYMRMGSVADNGRRKETELAKVEDKEQWVSVVVTALRDELVANKLPVAPGGSPAGATPTPIMPPLATGMPISPETLKLEVSALQTALDTMEERVRLLRESLGEIQSLNNMD